MRWFSSFPDLVFVYDLQDPLSLQTAFKLTAAFSAWASIIQSDLTLARVRLVILSSFEIFQRCTGKSIIAAVNILQNAKHEHRLTALCFLMLLAVGPPRFAVRPRGGLFNFVICSQTVHIRLYHPLHCSAMKVRKSPPRPCKGVKLGALPEPTIRHCTTHEAMLIPHTPL